MTIGEIEIFEKTLGRRATQAEIREEETRKLKEVKSHANRHGYSDVDPYEVIKKISDTTVEIRAMKAVQTKFPQDFHKGGFVGHYADNRSGQDYDYFSEETNEIIRIRWSKPNRRWQDKYGNRYYMSDEPYKFYDYNF